MIRLLTTTVLLLYGTLSFAQNTFTYSGDGDWDDVDNWSPSYPGRITNQGDTIIISTDANVEVMQSTINGPFYVHGHIKTRSRLTLNTKTIVSQGGEIFTASTFDINDTIINYGKMRLHSFTTLEGVLENHDTLFVNSFFYNNGDLVTKPGALTRALSFFYGINRSHVGNAQVGVELNAGVDRNDIGVYRFNDNVAFSRHSSIIIDMNTTEADKILVGDTARVAGKLSLKFSEDFVPRLGRVDTILKANVILGTFEDFVVPTFAERINIIPIITDQYVILKVVERPFDFAYVGQGEWTEFTNWLPHYPGLTIRTHETVTILDTASVNTFKKPEVLGKLINNGNLNFRFGGGLDGELENNGFLTLNSIYNIDGKLINRGTLRTNSVTNVNDTLINHGSVNSFSRMNINNNVQNHGDWFFFGETIIANKALLVNDSTINFHDPLLNYGKFQNNRFAFFRFPVKGNNITHSGNAILEDNLEPQKRNSNIGTYKFQNNLSFNKHFSTVILDVYGDSTDKVIVGDTLLINCDLEIRFPDSMIIEAPYRTTLLEARHVEGKFADIKYLVKDLSVYLPLIHYTDSTVELEIIERPSVFAYSSTGLWKDEINWSPYYPGEIIYENDTVKILDDAFVTINSYITNQGDFQNYGELLVNAVFTNDNVLSNYSIATFKYLEDFGHISNEGDVTISERLSGTNRTHEGNLVFDAQLEPKSKDSEVGSYEFTNNLSLKESSNLVINILNDTQIDFLSVGEQLALAGTLEIRVLRDDTLEIGYTDTIVSAGEITGTFKQIKFSEYVEGSIFKVKYTAQYVILELVEDVLTSTDEIYTNTLSVFPNPARDFILVEGVVGPIDYAVYSVRNELISNSVIYPDSSRISLHGYEPGVYFIRMKGKAIKFIVE